MRKSSKAFGTRARKLQGRVEPAKVRWSAMAGYACLLRQTDKFVKLFYVFHIIENTQDFYPACHSALFAFASRPLMLPVQKPARRALFLYDGSLVTTFLRLGAAIAPTASIS